MQNPNVWLITYDLDFEAIKNATVVQGTIYNHVRNPWIKQGFRFVQGSAYSMDNVPDAEDRIRAALEKLEKKNVRRYIRSMVLKGPDGTDYDIVKVLDERQATRLASEALFNEMFERFAANKANKPKADD